MSSNYFKVLRSGINSTFQDKGRSNLYHLGIPFSGAMDNRNYLLANKLVNNDLNNPVLEFALQGPHLKYIGEQINFSITGDVLFKIKSKDFEIDGNCYETYEINDEDEIDILSTNKSVYGYLAISGKFDVIYQWGSCSTNTKSNIGANKGKKLSDEQNIKISKSNKDFNKKKLNYFNSKIEKIRVIKGTNFNYFSEKAVNNFFEKEFKVSKLSDRMGMRLEGPQLENIFNTNIKSEGLIKGVIQVPGDGKPIVMLSDHGTIGGYPKIAVIISADYDRLVQLPSGSKIKFQQIELSDAETLYKMYEMETQNLLNQI
tara:strand:- start:925 stop:1869 length:945 start_codon:yes stop_codon:yes gene_type:complete